MFFPTKKLTFVTSIYQVINRFHKYKISFCSWLSINCLIWALVTEALKSHRKFLIHHPLWISVLRKPIQVIISEYGCPLDIDPNLKFWVSNVYETKYRSEICIKYNGFRTYSRIQVRDIRITSEIEVPSDPLAALLCPVLCYSRRSNGRDYSYVCNATNKEHICGSPVYLTSPTYCGRLDHFQGRHLAL